MDDPPLASSSTSPNSILAVLLSLPIAHPAHLELLKSHRPFTHPSHLDASAATKWLNRIQSAVQARDDVVSRRAGCELAKAVIEQDEEGWVLNGWGKGWIGACLGAISAQNVSLSTVVPPIQLLEGLVLSARGYPGFEREAVQPVMGKLAVTLTKLLEQCIMDSKRAYDVLYHLLESIRTLLVPSPSPWRPTLPSLRSQLITLVLHAPSPPSTEPIICPPEVRRAAVELLASLHLSAGKANSSAAWSSDLKDALGGFGACMAAITADGYREEPPRISPPSTSSLPPLPTDPTLRLPLALEFLDGYTEIILALLRFPTSRPVNVPVAALVSAALRALNLTLSTPMLEYASPTLRAALLASLPRIWGSGLLLLAGTASAVGDNIFPHMSEILDHIVYLAESVPTSMISTHVSLLRFFRLWLELYPAAVLPLDYIVRLLKMCLGRLSPLLDKRPITTSAPHSEHGGKRGKKRARGMEDGLVAGLEGRSAGTIGEEAEIALEALHLVPHLHQAPLLPPALLTFSIRLHLSIYLNLDHLNGRFEDSTMEEELSTAVKHVLSEAVMLGEEEGTQRGWKSLIIGLLNDPRGKFNLLLHPSLPPLHRPAPPLSSLHFFAPENEEEKRLRQDLGFLSSADDTPPNGDSIGAGEDAALLRARTGGGSGNGGRRVSDAEHTHVSQGVLQNVPFAMITTPTQDKSNPIPIVIDPGPASLAGGVVARESGAPVGIPVGLVRGTSLNVHQRTEPMPALLAAASAAGHNVANVEAFFSEHPSATATTAAITRASTESSAKPVMVQASEAAKTAPPPPAAAVDDEDEGIPELDSGSSDEDGMDEDDAEDE